MQIKLYASLGDVAGTRTVEIEDRPGLTVGEALREVTRRHPSLAKYVWDAQGRLSNQVKVIYRGKWIQVLQGLETPLAPGEALHVFPPVGGG